MMRDEQEQAPGNEPCESSALPGAFSPPDNPPLMPREKLSATGRASLTDEELLAIFLRTGLQGCGVLELAAMLKQRAGSLAALATLEAADITELCRGIGPAKAATLAAAFELGRRAALESRHAIVLKEPKAVYDYMAQELRHLDQEHLYVLMLNTRYELIRKVEIARGTLTRLLIHPRDIYREAVRASAHSILLVHNHPSGHPTPSEPDKGFTEQVEAAGKIMLIPLRDHIIIGAPIDEQPAYYSFREHGLIST